MNYQRGLDRRGWIDDLRSGMSYTELMDKYGLSMREFSSLLVQAIRLGILVESGTTPRKTADRPPSNGGMFADTAARSWIVACWYERLTTPSISAWP